MPPFNLIVVLPLRYTKSRAFVDGPGRHGIEEVLLPEWEISDNAKKLRALRREMSVGFRDMRRITGLSPVDVSNLEMGACDMLPEQWTALFGLLQKAK